MTAMGAAWPGRREDEFESIVIEVLKVFNVQVEQSREEDESYRHEERGDIRCRGAD
jgi:hypothetical protein